MCATVHPISYHFKDNIILSRVWSRSKRSLTAHEPRGINYNTKLLCDDSFLRTRENSILTNFIATAGKAVCINLLSFSLRSDNLLDIRLLFNAIILILGARRFD